MPRPSRPWLTTTALSAAIIAIAAGCLLAMGRTPWSRSGIIRLWTGDAGGPENSQQLSDPYTFTHVTHGILLYALLRWLAPNVPLAWRLVLAVGLESAWEVIENTDAVIGRYRAATMALGYYGDSVLNSAGDVVACVAGFALAARLPTRVTVALVIALELILTLTIRDSLLLNLIMLVHPIAAVKSWQSRM